MWSTSYLKCLVQGHTSSAFTYKRMDYQYCLRCGKVKSVDVSRKNSVTRESSQHLTREAVGTLRTMNITR